MNIYTVRDNLIQTIEGKEDQLAKMFEDIAKYKQDQHYTTAAFALVRMLEINIDELKRILRDVRICCDQATEASLVPLTDRVVQLKKHFGVE